ncbi:hypothetical protein LAZ67_8002883 [Cordylochernes scorpioides]|uniref:Transposase n=1 Tax=Cordylochernes scorpioides TaxID=51811 RepID=A0ABY6KR91_9ARAC|nr:hypothetical protein LAZ67_8002883 [Cordylochernes scorpioides]
MVTTPKQNVNQVNAEKRPKTATTPVTIEEAHHIVLNDRRVKVCERAKAVEIYEERVRNILHEESELYVIEILFNDFSTFANEWNEIVFTDESRFCRQHHDGRIRVWRHHGARMLNSCVMHRHTGPAPGIMVWVGIGHHSHTPLVRIAGTLNSQRYISEVLEPVVLPYLQCLPTAIFQQGNARPLVASIVQRFFVNRQIELLP